MNIIAIMAGGMDGPVESGTIGRVIEQRGGTLHWFYRRSDDGFPLDIQAYDALIVFGGEVSVHDPALKPYFDDLSALIHRFYAAKKPILGSCLGCQAIAYAFGAKVKPQGFLEYGFTQLTLEDDCQTDPLLHDLACHQQLFEMHSDTFDLPIGAIRLMSGTDVANQAYRIGDNTYGFQCHFEVSPEIVSTWTHRELIDNPSQDQTRVAELFNTVKEGFAQHKDQQDNFATTVVNRWLDLVEVPISIVEETRQ